jgi:hypothetical protein
MPYPTVQVVKNSIYFTQCVHNGEKGTPKLTCAMTYDLHWLCFTVYYSTTGPLGCHSVRLYINYYSHRLYFLHPLALVHRDFQEDWWALPLYTHCTNTALEGSALLKL